MPSFEKLFIESKAQPIQYKDETLYLADFISVEKEFKLFFTLVSTNSEWPQFVRVSVAKGGILRIYDKTAKTVVLSEHELQDGIEITGTAKDKQVMVCNGWRLFDGLGNVLNHSCMNGAAMKKEIRGDTIRYYCNDGHPDDNFDDIVFEVTVL